MSSEPIYTGNPSSYDLSQFAQGITGTCLCGNIRVTIHDSELLSRPRGHLCHCANCRKVAGSVFSANLICGREVVEVEDGVGGGEGDGDGKGVKERVLTLRRYEDRATGSGRSVWRSFCGGCGCPIMSEPDMLPDKRIVKMGLFPRMPKPEMETFVEHKQEWEGSLEGLVQYVTVRGGRKVGE